MHVIPYFNIFNGCIFKLDFDFGYGLDETFEQDFEFVLFVVSNEAVDVGFVLLCSWYLVHELFSKCIEELFKHDSAVDWFEASDKV